MFAKQLFRPLQWLQRNRLVPENLWRTSYSVDASKLFLEKILASPGPESNLPAGMNTKFKDMDPEMQEVFKKVIQCEYKVKSLTTFNQIADWITEDMWEQLYHTRSHSGRHTLMKKFYVDQRKKHVKEAKKTASKSIQSPVHDNKMERKSNHYVVRCGKTEVSLAEKHRQLRSQFHGINLVIDLKDVHKMKQKEQNNVLNSVYNGLTSNATAREPFHMVLCNSNLPKMALTVKYRDMSKHFTDITEKSYLDLFPRKELVYLSPSARGSRVQYDSRYTYIIGGLSMNENQDISLARAMKDNIRVQEIPLKKYFRHINSRRVIPIEEVVTVMLSLKANDGLYEAAFQSILSHRHGVNSIKSLLKGYCDPLQEEPVSDEGKRILNTLYNDLPKKYEFRLKTDMSEPFTQEEMYMSEPFTQEEMYMSEPITQEEM
ncbi:mitochondrial ribonuclease P protein 1-like [Mizuhopecten yessoensis]|uniref:Mitochondrial ribonuclease P protein 1 n=1 Tax=Mizuhopecten yessoensis TaxID=6573 RepID=A0A210QRS0_MIZYE|nr:mitochondrial ribonuclease P protein 1-like [Mizuhopecten yessoensis]XP_021351580.1 mitochondrial ribonuclease P protein 1-like [Mizuhopecten yessoensis]OWF51432.1 Mitochondrial ribonuclease P protein 1 [Mizuhopecten yessoensis]